ncbi:MAG: MBL fold metallo-hydrolase [Actinomycetota bacterium]|nr:MBL fold metallo-hydrolase [Actinomycetota bacterium]
MSDQRRGGRDPRELAPGVFQLPTDYPEVCNAPLWSYLVASGSRFALVDPGVRSTMAACLERAVREVGFDPASVEVLVATHGHPDHSGGQSSWSGIAPTARIAAPLADASWVESFDHQWTQFWDSYPGTLDLRGERGFLASLCTPEPRVDVLLRDHDVLHVGGRHLDVVETRGHTWGHCAYFDSETATLFCGDAVQGHGITSSDGRSVFAPLYLDVDEARRGLERLLDVPFERLCPAHVAPLDRGAGLGLIRDSLAFVDEADRLARDVVDRAGPVRTRELAEAIGEMCGTNPPVSPQTVGTARAHLYAIAREGLLEAAWLPRGDP